MAVNIQGDNNGIAVDGDLTIEKLEFEFGQGVKRAWGVHEDATVIDADESIVDELLGIFYGDRDKAIEFLDKAKVMKDTDICQYVKKLVKDNVISELSCKKPLWEILNKHGIYKAGYRNWANQV